MFDCLVDRVNAYKGYLLIYIITFVCMIFLHIYLLSINCAGREPDVVDDCDAEYSTKNIRIFIC